MKSRFLFLILLVASILFTIGCEPDFSGCEPSDYTNISGKVASPDGSPLAGITMEMDLVIDGEVDHLQGKTNGNGEYSFFLYVPESGEARIAPVSNDYAFQPEYQVVEFTSGNLGDITEMDFTVTKKFSPAERLQHIIDHLAEGGDAVTDYSPLGISAAVYSPEQGLWHGVAGPQEEGGTAVTDNMLFSIGGMTKTFIAALFLTYLEDPDKKLDLTDTIGCKENQILYEDCWLADEQLPENIPRDIITTITVEDLLYDRSGLMDVMDSVTTPQEGAEYIVSLYTSKPSADELIHSFFGGINYNEEKKRASYSDVNFTILGVILETVIGPTSTVDREIKKLLAACGLDLPNTFFTYPDGFPADKNLVRGHAWLEIPEEWGALPYDVPAAWRNENDPVIKELLNNVTDEEFVQVDNYAGAMVSTAEDIVKWAVALYQDTGDGGSQILSAANRALMLHNLGGSSFPWYGAGTVFFSDGKIGHSFGRKTISLYNGRMIFDPQTGEASVILCNKDLSHVKWGQDGVPLWQWGTVLLEEFNRRP